MLGAFLAVSHLYIDTKRRLQAETGQCDRVQARDVEERNGQQGGGLRRIRRRAIHQASGEDRIQIEFPRQQRMKHIAMRRDGALRVAGELT